MKGYYTQEESGTDLRVPTGRLRIEVMNLPELQDLINQAKHEADQLQRTINRLSSFNLEIDFGLDESTSSES
ncbi:hypothetical protein [Blautia obeum]|uniref:hypothetical protein n=1 Tax=Blautia obeum TaxID=40520 RepID=UPI003CFF62EE